MQDLYKTVRHLSNLFLVLVALFGPNVSAETQAQNCVTCNLNQNVFPAINDLNSGLDHVVYISSQNRLGRCSMEQFANLRDSGEYSNKKIRELCEVDSYYAPDYALKCGCYSGFTCPIIYLATPDRPCSCITPYGSCKGQAF